MLYPANSHSQCVECSLMPFCARNEQIDLNPKKRKLKRHEILHRPNEAFTYLYAIRNGGLKTHFTSQPGKEMIQNLYLRNEIYGCDAIYSGRYVYYATALTETIVCEITYHHFLKLLQLEPQLLALMLGLMSRQLANGAYLQFSSAQQRLCAWLLDIAARLLPRQSQQAIFLLPMTYQDIGHYLGLTAETVCRLFSQLKRDGIISIQNKQIRFLQMEKIKVLASVGCY